MAEIDKGWYSCHFNLEYASPQTNDFVPACVEETVVASANGSGQQFGGLKFTVLGADDVANCRFCPLYKMDASVIYQSSESITQEDGNILAKRLDDMFQN